MMSGFLYLAAAVLFILSIRGLSSPKSARLGNYLGIIGMSLAIATALFAVPAERLLPIIFALALGIGKFSFLGPRKRRPKTPPARRG